MKLLVSLVFIAILTGLVYFYASPKFNRNKKQEHTTKKLKPAVISIAVAVLLLTLLAALMYMSATALDTQCTSPHASTISPPSNPASASDYFLQGNYDYDIGNCKKALLDYTQSIQLDQNYPQAYNNRAYTYMRMHDYQDALHDLDHALSINPDYVQALMNRGDIYNYYYAIDKQRAVADYEKVVSLGKTSGTSVCGHLFLAKHNGWNLGTVLDLPNVVINPCN